jgi:Protein of unknown function (DUF2569)
MVSIESAQLRNGVYDKVGGWLVLPAIATYLAPFFMTYASFDNFRYFSASLPTTAQQILVGFGLAFAALAICWVYACILLSRLDPFFPKTFAYLSLALIIVNFADVAILSSYTGNKPTVEDNRDLIRSIVQSAIWVPYMLISKRVKATFYGIPMPAKQLRVSLSSAAHAPIQVRPTTDQPPTDDAARLKRKGHRFGIFLTLISVVLLAIGILNDSGYSSPPWASFFAAVGAGGVLLSYLFARLWYWFKAA